MESRTSTLVQKLKKLGLVTVPAVVCWSALSLVVTAQDHHFRELPPTQSSTALQPKPVAPRPIPQNSGVVNAGGTVATDGQVEQVNFWAMAAVRPAASYRLSSRRTWAVSEVGSTGLLIK